MNKLTDNIQANAEIDAINEIIDHLNTRDLGQIIPSTIPLTDAGLHLLDGALIQGSGIYSAFVDYIASIYDASASYFCSESDWQTEVTLTGSCDKYVYDSVNNTVRLPKIGNQLIHSLPSTLGVKGNGNNIGLTNGASTPTYVGLGANNGLLGITTGNYGVTLPNSGGQTQGLLSGQAVGLTPDATKSGIVTDTSKIVSADVYYYVVIATTTKTEIEVDIDEIATDLNGKCDVDGSNATFPHIVETYVNGTSWYNVYSNGWCEQGGYDAEGTVDYGVHTIEFLKPYVDTNYTLTAWYESYYSSAANVPIGMVAYRNKQTASFQRLTSTTTYRAGCSWEAKGYIR